MRPLLMIPLGLAVTGVLTAGCTAAEPAPPQTTAAATEPADLDPHDPDPHGHDHGHELAPAPDTAETTARAFTEAWLDAPAARADLDAWLETLSPHTHGPYLEALATIDPANLPTDTLDGDLAAAATDRPDTAAFTATGASGAQWTVELFAGDGRWLVYAITPVQAPA